MLRSRGTSPGRFHTSPRRRLCVYFSRAGATVRIPSGGSIGFSPCSALACWPWADDAAIRRSVASVAVKIFISTSFGIEQPPCDQCGAEHDQRADKEHGTEVGNAGDQSERRTGKSESHIEKSGVSAHGEASALRRRTAHCFDTKARISERIAEAGKRCPDQCQRRPRRQPDQRLTSRFDQYGNQRDLGAADPVRQMAEDHARAAKSSATKAVTAPKPTLLSAKPAPGNHTAETTLLNAGRPRAVGATRRSRATSSNVARGPSVVASAIAVKPWLPYKVVPTGAPSAKAAYIAVPIQARTLPVFCGPPSTSPQLCAPVMMKLSPAPSSARPRSRIVTEIAGSLTKRSDSRYSSPAKAETIRPVTTACLAPRLSACRPAHTRETSDAANWLPATRPTMKVLRPRPWCT